MKHQFRITSLAFDEDEAVSSVTAVVSEKALEVFSAMLGAPLQASLAACENHPGCTGHLQVTLPLAKAMRLHSACGKVRGIDPQYEQSTEAYDSLTMVGNLGEDW